MTLCDYPYSAKNKQSWLLEKEREYRRIELKEFLAGLIGIPMIFDGNVLCPECFWKAMDIYGHTYFCKHCGGEYPATIVVDKWGRRWLALNGDI